MDLRVVGGLLALAWAGRPVLAAAGLGFASFYSCFRYKLSSHHNCSLHFARPLTPLPGRCVQGFLQFAPKSAVGKLMGAAAAGAAAEYSSPRPTPKGGPATTAVPRIIANSSITFRPHHA